ncbi:MAG: hypothetical protein QOH31_2201 [Verrucomicrobiota bacterium]
MDSARMGLRVAALIFGFISLGHLWRVIAHLHVQIGRFTIPQWLSGLAVVAFGLLSLWLWRLSTKQASA